jgi:hypothetical protein
MKSLPRDAPDAESSLRYFVQCLADRSELVIVSSASRSANQGPQMAAAILPEIPGLLGSLRPFADFANDYISYVLLVSNLSLEKFSHALIFGFFHIDREF